MTTVGSIIQLTADDNRKLSASLIDSTKLVAEMTAWRPIATAPIDGTDILLWWKSCKVPAVGSWSFDDDADSDDVKEGWRCDGDDCIPRNQQDCTHWMPLPAGPTA